MENGDKESKMRVFGLFRQPKKVAERRGKLTPRDHASTAAEYSLPSHSKTPRGAPAIDSAVFSSPYISLSPLRRYTDPSCLRHTQPSLPLQLPSPGKCPPKPPASSLSAMAKRSGPLTDDIQVPRSSHSHQMARVGYELLARRWWGMID